MLGKTDYSLQDLFKQLGLDNSDDAINSFISTHQLANEQDLISADFWSEKQRMFLQEEWKRDAVWVEVIDDLNIRLHPDA